MSTLLLHLLVLASVTPDPPCSARPLPPAIDQLDPVQRARVVTFAATPSMDYPGRAWVVRLSQSAYKGPASLEIVRLRRQSNCNRYVLEKNWHGSLPEEQFKALVNSLAGPTTPAANLFSTNDPMRAFGDVVLDGTGIQLRMKDHSWEITRTLNHYGNEGRVVSSLFYDIVSRYVPTADQPSPSWSSSKRESRKAR